jgi:hypothetical protein
MRSFYIWLGSLDLIEGISLFLTVAFLLFIMPYFTLLKDIVKIILRSEKAEIKSFNYSISNDHLLAIIDEKEYYLHPSKPGFVLNGGKIILNWEVTGAFRIDLFPIQKKIKGNTAEIIVSRENTVFQLTVYTLKGKFKAELSLPIEEIKNVNTVHLWNENKQIKRYNPKVYKNQFSRGLKIKNLFPLTVFKNLNLKKIFIFTEFNFIGKKKNQTINKLNNYIFNAGRLNLKGYRPSRFNQITNENFFNKKVKSNE